jgi:hypothetical protein
MAVASSYLARLGPKGIVTVLESNTARHSIGDPNKPKYNWYLYYEAQAEMNVCACILQSPERINVMWDVVKRLFQLRDLYRNVREEQSGVNYYSAPRMPQAALRERPLSPPRYEQETRGRAILYRRGHGQHQDKMNHWARIFFPSPESIGKVWEEEQLSEKKESSSSA